MAAALVQNVPVRTTGSTPAQITLNGVAAGALIIVESSDFDPILSVGSNRGSGGSTSPTTLSVAVNHGDGSPGTDYNEVGVWYLENATGGNYVLSINSNGGAGNAYISATAQEWSGMVTSGVLDRTGIGANALTATASAANTGADRLVITAVVADLGSSNNNFGTPSGYTLLDRENDSNSFTGYQAAYKTVSALETSTATHTATGGTASQYDTVIATFKIAAGGGGTSLTPGQDAIALTGPAPTLAQTANQSLTPAQDAVVLTGIAPTLVRTANLALVPAADALVLTGMAPTVTQGAGLTLTPGQDAIALSGLAPTLAQTANQALTPAQDAVALTGIAPTIAQTANQALAPGADAVILTGFAPSVVQASASVSLVPGTAALNIVGWAPSFVQTGANPYPLGSGGGPLEYFPSQAEIRDQVRRERTAKWIREEQARTLANTKPKPPKPKPAPFVVPRPVVKLDLPKRSPKPAKPVKDTRAVAQKVKAAQLAKRKRRQEEAIARALMLLLE